MADNKQYPSSKEIIYLLGMGALLVGIFVAPGLALAAGKIYQEKRKRDWEQNQKAWKKFNSKLLKRNLKRLQQQKVVEITEEGGQQIIKLTQKGQSKYLKFKLEDLSLKETYWDGKWRMVIYDIEKLKKASQENFRRLLKQMNFLLLQKSVYLTPFKCREEIEYLREYFGLGKEVLYMEVNKLENEEYYRQYFGVSR